MKTDSELLRAYVAGDERAFEELVARYVDLVHGVAARRARGSAEDVTQAVFLILSQKARVLAERGTIGGWLYATATLCAKRAVRARVRRERYERGAVMRAESRAMEEGARDEEMLGLLDEGIARLPAAERELVILRHLQNRELSAIAEGLGISQAAATKRVQRAVERLRVWFAGRVGDVSASAVTGVLVRAAGHKAPAGMMKAGAGAGAAALAKGAGSTVAIAGGKAAVAAGVVVASVVAVGVAIGARAGSGSARTSVGTARARVAEAMPVVDERKVPGRMLLARMDLMVDGEGAAAVRGIGRPAPEARSSLYAGYRASTHEVERVLKVARAGGHLFAGNLAVTNPVEYTDGVLPTAVQHGSGFTIALERNGIYGGSGVEQGTAKFRNVGSGIQMTVDLGEVKAWVEPWTGRDVQEKVGELHFDGLVGAGETVFFVADVGTVDGVALTHVVLWQVFKASDAQFAVMRGITSGAAWIDHGPTEMRAIIDRAAVWARGPVKRFSDVPARFVKGLSNGAEVRVLAVGRPREFPFCWWRGDGVPTVESPEWNADDFRREEVVIVEVKAPGAGGAKKVRALDGGWFSYGGVTRYFRSSAGDVQVEPVDGRVEVGVSIGGWKTIGELRGKGRVSVDDATVEVQKISANDAWTVIDFGYRGDDATDVRVLAVDKSGVIHDVIDAQKKGEYVDWPGVRVVKRTGKWEAMMGEYRVKPEDFDHSIVQVRGGVWVRVVGFAEMPGVAVPGLGV
ncbi:MAG: RNA polymerase sigma factor, partial [Phycisphaerae bacterium]